MQTEIWWVVVIVPSWSEKVLQAMQDGKIEWALRLALLSEDKSLLRRLLLFSQPSIQYFKQKTTLNALCVTFLDFLETPEEANLIFPWITCLLRDKEGHNLVASIDPRIVRHIEDMLFTLSALPTKEGLIAARLHHELTTSGVM